MKQKLYARGTMFAILGGALWAVAGLCGQYIFEEKHLDASWYVAVRLMMAGVILLFFSWVKFRRDIFSIWKDKKDAAGLLVYGIMALMGVQLTHFLAVQYCNAATATVIMYLSPAFVLAWLCLVSRRAPGKIEIFAVALAVAGVFLLVTHGDVTSLSITGIALFWSVASAILMAFYSVQPKKLIDKWGSLLTNAWGMTLGGGALCIYTPPWQTGGGRVDVITIAIMVMVVLFGTVAAFWLFLEGMRIIGSQKASVYACAEPLFTAVFGVICLGIDMTATDWIGAFLIVVTVVILALEPGKKKESPQQSSLKPAIAEPVKMSGKNKKSFPGKEGERKRMDPVKI